jgi:ubiquinone biosynthesis protein Coq4
MKKARPTAGVRLATDEEMEEMVDEVRADKEGNAAFRQKYQAYNVQFDNGTQLPSIPQNQSN